MFGKRPSELTPDDIQRIVGEQEGSEVEFKGTLPTKQTADPWVLGEGSWREVGGDSAARLRGHAWVDQAARSRSVGERSRVGQPSIRRMVI